MQRFRSMLTKLIKEESLRTYLFTYSHVYDSISMATLADMFELQKPTVHSIISKMIINEELMVICDVWYPLIPFNYNVFVGFFGRSHSNCSDAPQRTIQATILSFAISGQD